MKIDNKKWLSNKKVEATTFPLKLYNNLITHRAIPYRRAT